LTLISRAILYSCDVCRRADSILLPVCVCVCVCVCVDC
jgi:hypothetical protein